MTVPTWVFYDLLRVYGYTCTYCGWWGVESDFTTDHAIPRILGGSDAWQNLRLACTGCNAQKGIKTEMDYRIWRTLNPREANYGPY